MKRILPVLLILFLAGCAGGGEKIRTFIENPPSILKDPHYAEFQKNMDDLERSYLQKEITYAEYLENKKRLEETYAEEVQARQDTIENYRADER